MRRQDSEWSNRLQDLGEFSEQGRDGKSLGELPWAPQEAQKNKVRRVFARKRGEVAGECAVCSLLLDHILSLGSSFPTLHAYKNLSQM